MPTTKEKITYEATGALSLMLELYTSLPIEKTIPMWNNMLFENQLPPQFRNYAYKLSQEWLIEHSTVEDGLVRLDKEWDDEVKAMKK